MSTESEEIIVKPPEFIEDVAAFMQGRTADAVIQELNDRYRQYKMLESQFLQKKIRLHGKLPELQKAVTIVNTLIDKAEKEEELVVDFELSDQVFAKSRVQGLTSLNLWLGAGVMVEYPLDEAKQLLETNLSNCKANIKTNSSNIDFIKDCITVTEVSIARVYNYDVERRRNAKEETAS